MPALTTAFDEDLQVDHEFIARHARWQIENGGGLVALGSLARRQRCAWTRSSPSLNLEYG
jgi:4-hydroxy-tetrahydrodipicolinate synthase